MSDSPIARLNEYGQSPWYDNVSRPALVSGLLARLISQDGIRGGTSNPTIFENALAGSDVYDDELRALARDDRDTTTLYWDLLLTDIAKAAEMFRPVFDETGGQDGYVSIELDPDLARDADASIVQARELLDRLNASNVMVKIPGTREGLRAISTTIAEGHNVNVTLIFSLRRYAEVIDAYLSGLERLEAAGGDLSRVASVASFFVSRVDTEVDARLPDGHELRGRAAVANARLAYRLFRERFSDTDARWAHLASAGARAQRPLWASTSTKNPDYPDTLYVDELVGPDTVNTLADPSIEALRDHGAPRPGTVEEGLDAAGRTLDALADAGVDFDDVTATLEEEGIAKFSASHHQALATIEKRRSELTG